MQGSHHFFKQPNEIIIILVKLINYNYTKLLSWRKK